MAFYYQAPHANSGGFPSATFCSNLTCPWTSYSCVLGQTNTSPTWAALEVNARLAGSNSLLCHECWNIWHWCLTTFGVQRAECTIPGPAFGNMLVCLQTTPVLCLKGTPRRVYLLVSQPTSKSHVAPLSDHSAIEERSQMTAQLQNKGLHAG